MSTASASDVNADTNVSRNASGKSYVLNGGDSVVGEVLAKDGKNVTISLGEGSVVSARLDIAADISVGSSILFNVKSSDSNGLVLSPLFTNMDTGNPVSKALTSAGLLATDKNLLMVSTMMQEGMSVSKSELHSMSGALENISVSDIPDAVMLHKLGIEVNQDNIEQFGLYKNYEHQVSGAVNEIMDLVTDTLSGMAEGENGSAAISFASDLLDIFTSNGAMFTDDSETGILDQPVNELLGSEDLSELVQSLEQNGLPEEFGQSVINGEVSLKEMMLVIDDLVKSQFSENAVSGDEQELLTAQTTAEAENITVQEGSERAPQILNDTASTAAAETIGNKESIGLGEGLDFLKALTAARSSSVNPDQASAENIENSNASSGNDRLLSLISSKAFGNILKTAINAEWKLIPQQVAEDKQVSNLYKRMTEQTNRLLDSINSRAETDSPLAQKAAELNKNVNFMNEMNNCFNYVQLPMRMSGSDAHGELYVYSNKKNLSSDDGTVSALLHLDMDHLGPTDVYVTMNSGNHVNTHFYLQDEYSLDLIAEHIDELNARLDKRGYSLTSEFSTRDKMTNIMNEIVESNTGNVPISSSAFDARA